MAKQTFQGRPVVAGDINGKALVSKQPFNPTSSYIDNIWVGRPTRPPAQTRITKNSSRKTSTV